MDYTLDYEDYTYPLPYGDALDYAARLVSEEYGITRAAAEQIIKAFDLLDTIFTDKRDSFREEFSRDAYEWNKTATLDELEYEEFLAANGRRVC